MRGAWTARAEVALVATCCPNLPSVRAPETEIVMTARQRRARGKRIRSRIARAKLLRRQARASGRARAVTAAAAALVSVAGVSTVTAAPTAVAETVKTAAGNAGVAPRTCNPHTPGS